MSRTTQVPPRPGSGFRLRGSHPLRPAFPGRSPSLCPSLHWRSYNPATCIATPAVWAPARSLATTCAITVVFFSSGYWDVSVPRVGPGLLAGVLPCGRAGCPIRTSALQGIFAPVRGFSQLVTSFVASESQGILHVPFSPFLFSFKESRLSNRFFFAAVDFTRPAAFTCRARLSLL